MKLALGTVQFGLDYGVSNKRGRTPLEEVRRILAVARNAGIELLDTAALYGDSESVLGQLAAASEFRVVTKTGRIGKARIEAEDVAGMRAVFMQSLRRLQCESVEAFLVHHVPDLLCPGGERLFEEMQRLKQEGRARKIGVSTYTPTDIDLTLARFAVDLVQVPCNVFDQRLISGGQLKELKRRGVEVHARSAFLQGLLLMRPDELPAHFVHLRPVLKALSAAAVAAGTDVLGLCLAFVQAIPEMDAVICGVTEASELEQLVQRSRARAKLPDLSGFSQADVTILDPSRWPPRAGA